MIQLIADRLVRGRDRREAQLNPAANGREVEGMVETMSHYTVRYSRDESGWWVAQVKEAPAAITQGRTISEARRRIREALALVLDDDVKAAKAKLVDDVKLPANETVMERHPAFI